MPPKFRRPPPPQATGSNDATADDDEAFFSRNPRGWANIKVNNIASPTKNSRDSSGSDGMSPVPKRRKGKSGKKGSDWTKPGAVITIGSDSEPDVPNDRGRQKSSSSPAKGKGKGKASTAVRDRSLTPPPDITQHALQEARRVVKAVLFHGQPDPDAVFQEMDADMVEEVEEEPEIRALISAARERDPAPSRSLAYDAQSPTYNDPSSPLNSPQEMETPDMLKLKVLWKGDPLPEGRAKWAFAFAVTAPFRRLNEMMQAKVPLPASEIVLVHNSRRVLLGATPKTLRMRKATSETIEIWPKQKWEAEGNSNTPATSPLVGDMEPVRTAPVPGAPAAKEAEAEDHKDEARNEVLVLNIRSGKYPNQVSISAKKTAKSSSVLTKYLKMVGEDIAAFDVSGDPKARGKRRIKLSFDGDELAGDAPVGNTDADDDEVWDVVGL